jgi:GH18 family chitinase
MSKHFDYYLLTCRNLDMINVMVYDFHGAFESFVGHYAPLYASSLDVTDEQKTLNVVRKRLADLILY